MAVISLFANGEALALDATTNVGYSRSASISTTSIFQGNNISDNYRPDLPAISVQGIVTATKTRGNEEGIRSPSDLRAMLDNWVDSKYLIHMYGTYDNSIPSLSTLAISSFEVGRDASRSDGLTVTLSLKQLDISTSVQLSSVTIPKSNTNGLSEKPSGNTPEGKTSENTKELDKTLKAQGLDKLLELADNA